MNTYRFFSISLLVGSLLLGAADRSGATCPTVLVRAIPAEPSAELLRADNRIGTAVTLGGGTVPQSGVDLPRYAAISAPFDNHGRFTMSGAVAIYHVGSDGSLRSESELVLVGGDTTDFDRFGFAVAMARDTAVLAVGADEHDGPNSLPNTGKVYLFERKPTGWVEQGFAVANTPGRDDRFGAAVALSANGNVLVVGAPDMDGDLENTGAVLVFRRQDNSGPWQLEQKLTAASPEPGDGLGWSVAIDPRGEEQIVAGAPQFLADRQAGKGKAFRFRYRNGSWQSGELLRTGTSNGDAFGFSVAILDSGLVAVGAPGAKDNAGEIRVFPDDRSDPQILETCESMNGAELGYSLATDGSSLVAGARRADAKDGAAYLFRCSTRSCDTALIKLETGPSGAELGRSVAVLRDLALAGAPLDQNDAGSAVAYDLGGVVVAKPELAGMDGSSTIVPGEKLKLTFGVANRSALGLNLPVDLRFPKELLQPILCRQVAAGGKQCNLPILEPGHAMDTLPIQGPAMARYEITGMVPPRLRGEIEASQAAQIPVGVYEPTPAGLAQSDRRALVPMATLIMDLRAPSKTIPGNTTPLAFNLHVENQGPSSILQSKLMAKIPNPQGRITGVTCRPACSCNADRSNNNIICTLGTGADRDPDRGRGTEFTISGMVPPEAVRPVTLEATSQPRRGEPGAMKTSRTVQQDPTATIQVEVNSPPNPLVPGASNVFHDITIRHTTGPSLFRGARIRASQDSELSCSLTCISSTGRSLCKQGTRAEPLEVNIENLSIGDQVGLKLNCGNLPPSGANRRGEIPAPAFTLTDIRPANFQHISVPPEPVPGNKIALAPDAKLVLTLGPENSSLPVVPGTVTKYKLGIANTGLSDSPMTRLFPCIGEVEQCPKVRLDCSTISEHVECISDPAGTDHSTVCVFLLPAGRSRECKATIFLEPQDRDPLRPTARARSVWPQPIPAGQTIEVRVPPVPLTPQAALNVAIKDAKEVTIDPPTSTDPPIPGARFKVNVSNAGPSDALQVKTSLVLPSLLPAENLLWSPEDDETSGSKPGNETWVLDIKAEPDPEMRPGRTLIASGPLATPDPLLRGPLVLRASSDSGDALPKANHDSDFTAVHVSAVEAVAAAALVVTGEFKKGKNVCYKAYLDNNTGVTVRNEDPTKHAFSVTLPAGLEINRDLADCPITPELMMDTTDSRTFHWDRDLLKDEVVELQFGATITDTSPGWICLRATTSLGTQASTVPGVEEPFVTDTHCPYNKAPESDTVFRVTDVPDETVPDNCRVAAGSSIDHCGDFSQNLSNVP